MAELYVINLKCRKNLNTWWMRKQKLLQLFNGLLFDLTKEWHSDGCYNVDKPWKYYTNWKKSDTKDHILCESIYIKISE